MAEENLIIVIGGGAAGFFGAIACAESKPDLNVVLLEKGSEFLQKVRISGGGRCNVTHHCFEPKDFVANYPRGSRELLGPFHRFQAKDTVDWFESRGVKLKTEKDGRMFPVSDSSVSIIEALMHAAAAAGVELRKNCAVTRLVREGDQFRAELSSGESLQSAKVLLAQGGVRTLASGNLAASLGHTIEPPVPSLFTFSVKDEWVRELAGVSAPIVEISSGSLKQSGPILLTHAGLSGPAVLRLSAWGARQFAAVKYEFEVSINWFPKSKGEALQIETEQRRTQQGARLVANTPFSPLSARLWEALVSVAGIPAQRKWSELNKTESHALLKTLNETRLKVIGKSLNKEEFVTCGGVRLSEVNFKSMESRISPGLHFAGEVLDIDGVTGGFNFQAAWSTGWIAGRAMAGVPD